MENVECRECGVWKRQSVENAECRKCGVWKMRSVKEKYIKSLKEKKKGNIATRRYNTQYNSSRPMPSVRTMEKHNTLNEMKFFVYFQNCEI